MTRRATLPLSRYFQSRYFQAEPGHGQHQERSRHHRPDHGVEKRSQSHFRQRVRVQIGGQNGSGSLFRGSFFRARLVHTSVLRPIPQSSVHRGRTEQDRRCRAVHPDAISRFFSGLPTLPGSIQSVYGLQNPGCGGPEGNELCAAPSAPGSLPASGEGRIFGVAQIARWEDHNEHKRRPATVTACNR